MSTLLTTIAVMALMMLAMALGVLVSGRRLKGSCGGIGGDCECDAAGRAACPRTKAQASS
jgi:hypothetical protein